MRRTARILTVTLAALATVLVAAAAPAATYRGRSVDERIYRGSILNYDYGLLDNVEVRFHAEHAYVSLHNGGRLVLVLHDEEIADPRRIPADDPRRGIVWEICLTDLGRR
jgi:hypothetical protein